MTLAPVRYTYPGTTGPVIGTGPTVVASLYEPEIANYGTPDVLNAVTTIDTGGATVLTTCWLQSHRRWSSGYWSPSYSPSSSPVTHGSAVEGMAPVATDSAGGYATIPNIGILRAAETSSYSRRYNRSGSLTQSFFYNSDTTIQLACEADVGSVVHVTGISVVGIEAGGASTFGQLGSHRLHNRFVPDPTIKETTVRSATRRASGG
jgi:hypothetical protein